MVSISTFSCPPHNATINEKSFFSLYLGKTPNEGDVCSALPKTQKLCSDLCLQKSSKQEHGAPAHKGIDT